MGFKWPAAPFQIWPPRVTKARPTGHGALSAGEGRPPGFCAAACATAATVPAAHHFWFWAFWILAVLEDVRRDLGELVQKLGGWLRGTWQKMRSSQRKSGGLRPGGKERLSDRCGSPFVDVRRPDLERRCSSHLKPGPMRIIEEAPASAACPPRRHQSSCPAWVGPVAP